MSSIPSNLARVSGNLVANVLTSNLRRNNVELLRTQEQIATGKRINRPSDDASAVSVLKSLQRTLNQFDQQLTNLSRAQSTIDTTDQALADVSDLLLEAQTIASTQVGVGSNEATRESEAAVIDAMITALLGIANREVRGVYLFGGENPSQTPFVAELGGIRYLGNDQDLQADLGLFDPLGVNTNGVDAFKALSTRVMGTVDLNPSTTADTRLVDVAGARGKGVTLGTITVNVDGMAVDVDLSTADRLGDVVARINDAINSIDPAAGALAIGTSGFDLTASAGHSISISDIGTSIIAADLGIGLSATGSTANGLDLNPRLTPLSSVSAFGPAVDLASGLKINQGGNESVISFASASTVQDMINIVKAASVGIRMEINAAGTGLNIINEVSGSDLSIGENAGGSTATDLGLRSYADWTLVSELNFGIGLNLAEGDDLRLHLHDGSDVDVDLSSAATVGDIIAAINAAGGGSVTASLAADGNGLVLSDNTIGVDDFTVNNLGLSHAATELGIAGNAGAGSTISGQDVAKVRTESVFTHLMMLRDGLLSSDDDLITQAGSALHEDVAAVASARAQMGVRSQRVQEQTTRLEERTLQTRSILSGLEDADLNEVITRFTQLQQQLEATILSGQQLLNLSLLDFLR